MLLVAQCKIPTVPESLQYLEKMISKQIEVVIHQLLFSMKEISELSIRKSQGMVWISCTEATNLWLGNGLCLFYLSSTVVLVCDRRLKEQNYWPIFQGDWCFRILESCSKALPTIQHYSCKQLDFLAPELQLHTTVHTHCSGRKSLHKLSHFSKAAANAPERSDKELHTHTHFYFNK